MIWSSHLEVGRLRFSVLVECLDWVMERQKNRDHSAGSWFTQLGIIIQLHFAVVTQFFSL